MTFKPPTMQEAKEYAKTIGYKTFPEVKWWHHYNSKGWYIGKNKMQSWKSAVWTWFTGTYEWRELQRKKSENKKRCNEQRERWSDYINTATELTVKEMRKAEEWEFLYWLIDSLRPEIKVQNDKKSKKNI